MKLRNALLLLASGAVLAHYWNDLKSPVSPQLWQSLLSNSAPAPSQKLSSLLLPKHKPVAAGTQSRRKSSSDCASYQRDNKPCYAVTAVSFTAPPVPDRGGNSVLGGLLKGALLGQGLRAALTAIEPNLMVCMTPTHTSATHAHPSCSSVCNRGEECKNASFSDRPILDGDAPMANVFVTNVDQRSGAGHTIASFTVDPTSCIRDTAQAQQPCMYPVDDKAAYADNAMVTIGFATAWQCPQTNYPLGNHPDWDYGKQLTTRYALVWTDYCAGIALDGILFELRGGGAPNPTPPSGAPARLPNPLCDPKQPHPNMMHIVQFVDSYCDTQSATACGDSYQVAGPNGTVLTRYYNQWYLDNSGGDKPCLVPDTLADGVHVVNDEASANLPNGTPLTKIFRAFVMRGTEVTEVIDWSRQGLQNPVQDSRAGGLPRELKSNYTVALDSSAQIKKQLRDPLCAAIHSASATAQQDPILVGVAASPYLGCTN